MNRIKVNNDAMMAMVIEALNKNQQAIFKVTGSSMRPFFIHEETSVILEKPKRPIRKHDIILFFHNNQYILHRVVLINQSSIICQGDALLSKEKILDQDIIGVVVAYERKGKTVSIESAWYRLKVSLWLTIRPIVSRLKRIRL